MVGVNQYIYKRELQFWSFFPVVHIVHEEEDGSFRYLKVSGKQFLCLQLGWYRDQFVPTDTISRDFLYIRISGCVGVKRIFQ